VREALVGAPGRPAREAFELGDATEARLGLELQPQYGELGVWARPALRLGWRLRSRGLLDYAGDDTVARFPGAGKSHEWSVGAALGPFEVAWISREPAGVWLLGVQHVF
jgi:hypothetical protein